MAKATTIKIKLLSTADTGFFYVTTKGGPGTTTNTLPVYSYNTAFSGFEMSTGATIAIVAMLAVAIFAVPYVRAVRREEQS